jgi:flagella basal body P-ring formation protein FlgA
MNNLVLTVYLLLHIIVASASPLTGSQDHEQIRSIAAAFVKQQSSSLPGKVTYTIGEIDQRIALSACARLEAFLPTGGQFIGKTAIGVRCLEKDGWSIYIPVQVKVSLSLLVSARQLPLGHVLQEQDMTSQTMEATQTEGITDPKQAIGKVLRYGVSAGQLLREDMLRPPYSVTQGRIVPLLVQSSGFSIRSMGSALGNASEGQTVKVRSSSGRVLDGVARANGVVEIGP